MIKLFSFLLFFLCFACATPKQYKNNEIPIGRQYKEVRLFKTYIVKNNDSLIYNELRFYKINSAQDTQKSMYLDYGHYNSSTTGLYQNNITRKIWKNVKLFENEGTFTIFADGTETMTDYFATLNIFDANNEDCLDENHPLKEKMISFFVKRMKYNKYTSFDYSNLE